MIDGRGEVRITDFGLATVSEQLQGPEVRHACLYGSRTIGGTRSHDAERHLCARPGVV
jgi:hypothetical protein